LPAARLACARGGGGTFATIGNRGMGRTKWALSYLQERFRNISTRFALVNNEHAGCSAFTVSRENGTATK
jgi:hypothetical protein